LQAKANTDFAGTGCSRTCDSCGIYKDQRVYYNRTFTSANSVIENKGSAGAGPFQDNARTFAIELGHEILPDGRHELKLFLRRNYKKRFEPFLVEGTSATRA